MKIILLDTEKKIIYEENVDRNNIKTIINEIYDIISEKSYKYSTVSLNGSENLHFLTIYSFGSVCEYLDFDLVKLATIQLHGEKNDEN